MIKIIRTAILSIFMLAAFCMAAETAAQSELSRHDKIYYFQHRILSKWTHGSEGRFYQDLRNGDYRSMLETASEIVSVDFAINIRVQRLTEINGVLLVFPVPDEPPECFFILITRDGGDYRFFTYEITRDILGDGSKGVVGEWTADGQHRDLGPRPYEDAEQFIRDIKAIM